MAADLSLIAYAAERHADELAAGGLGDRHTERGLAHAGRSDETEDRAFGVLDQAAHGEKLEDAFLDFLEPVVIAFEHAFGEFEIADFLGLLLPRHRQQPVEIVPADGGFGGHGRHVLQPLEFRHGLLQRVGGHAGFPDKPLQLIDFALFAAPQFLLDGLDLFVEVVLFLGLLHLALHAPLNGAVDIELFDLDVEHFSDSGEAVDGVEDFEQFLLLFNRELEVGAYGIGELAGLIHADGGNHGLVVQVLAELDVLFEEAGDAADELVELGAGFDFVRGSTHGGAEEAFLVGDGHDFGAFHAFHQDFDIAVGQLETLDDVDDGADAVDFVGLGFIDRGIVLGGKKDLLVARHCLFQRPHTGFAPHDERGHHVRKDDHIADGHHRQTFCIGFFLRSKHCSPRQWE